MNEQYPQKILIIRQGAIGDVVHTTEVFRSIKRLIPTAVVQYLTSQAPASLLINDPDLQKVIILKDRSYKGLFELAKEFRKENFDLIINLQPSLRFKILALLSCPKKIVTYKKDFKYHAVENFFLTAKKSVKNLELENELRLFPSAQAINRIKQMLPSGKLVAINTQSGPIRHGRKWKMEYFRELSDALIKEFNAQILIIGSKEDEKKLSIFRNCCSNIHIFAGRLSLEETAAMLSHCDLMISGDTGPLHIASATGHPVCIGLFGAMPIKRTGPWGQRHYALKSDLECIPCNKRKCKLKKSEFNPCLNQLKPSKVIELIKEEHLL